MAEHLQESPAVPSVIRFFRRDRHRYPWLSNFHPAPIHLLGTDWPTAEHLYQALKCDRLDEREKIRSAETPGEAKRLGRTVKVRPDWFAVRNDAMLTVLRAKFHQNPDLLQKLRDTGSALLEEDSPHDPHWGTGPLSDGKNILGQLLMQVRDETWPPSEEPKS